MGSLWVSMKSDHKRSKETENINTKVSRLTTSELITITGGNKSIRKSTSITLFHSSPSPEDTITAPTSVTVKYFLHHKLTSSSVCKFDFLMEREQIVQAEANLDHKHLCPPPNTVLCPSLSTSLGMFTCTNFVNCESNLISDSECSV